MASNEACIEGVPGTRPATKGGGIGLTTKAQPIAHHIAPMSSISNHYRASSGIAEHLCLIPGVALCCEKSRFITIREHHVAEGQDSSHPFHGGRVFDFDHVKHYKSTVGAGLSKALQGLIAFEGVQKEKASDMNDGCGFNQPLRNHVAR